MFYYLPDQSLYEMPHDNCAFGYRTSFFQKTPGCVILSAVFRLKKGAGEAIAAKMRALNQLHIRKTLYEKSGTVLVPEIIILPPDYALSDNGPEVPLNRVTGGLEAELNAAAAQETPES